MNILIANNKFRNSHWDGRLKIHLSETRIASGWRDRGNVLTVRLKYDRYDGYKRDIGTVAIFESMACSIRSASHPELYVDDGGILYLPGCDEVRDLMEVSTQIGDLESPRLMDMFYWWVKTLGKELQ